MPDPIPGQLHLEHDMTERPAKFPALALCALLAVAAWLLLREGHRGRGKPGHGRQGPHSARVGTDQQDHDAIEGDPT